MELRGQEKEIGMPNSLGYNQKLSSPPLASNTVGERRRDQSIHGNTTSFSPPQTLDHYPPFHHHLQSNLQQQTHKPRRDLDPNPDPAPAPIGATTSTPIANTSNLRSPPRPPPSPPAPPVRYRECLKNHAASTGGHVMDGCGEFMPSGEEGTAEALKCAACECHRNFHRKETDQGKSSQQYVAKCYNYRNKSSPHHPPPPLLPPQPPQLHQHQIYSPAGPIQPMMMAFGGSAGAPAESSSEDLNMFQSDVGHGQASVHQQQPPLSKKRFRTKFSQEQKDRMMEFAEKLEWKIQKQDEQEVQRFCGEVDVKRQVFKVWMHNNKQAMKKKQM